MHSEAKAEFHYGGAMATIFFVNQTGMLQISNVALLYRDFYFRALGSLVVLSFPQLLSFSSVFPKTLSETITDAVTAGCPTVDRYLLTSGAT
jgi:hypothetical protein